MKSLGIIRQIDDLGRIVIPKEIRTSLGIKKNQLIKFHLENGNSVFLEIISGSKKTNFGIFRQLDELGRIVIPKETRCILDLDFKTPVEFFSDEKNIILKKYVAGCTFCGSTEDIRLIFEGKKICKKCLSAIKEK